MKLLLHICCGNCAVYPVSSLRSQGEMIAGYWSNPNIHPIEEHSLRLDSLKRLSDEWKFDVIYDSYNPDEYFTRLNQNGSHYLNSSSGSNSSRDWSDWNGCNSWNGSIPSVRDRCRMCYHLRLEKTAGEAKRQGFDAFSTTLLISPYQDFDKIIETGALLAEQYNILFYKEDFRPHFREALARARGLGLYQQKYCGCMFSLKEKAQRVKGSKSQRQ